MPGKTPETPVTDSSVQFRDLHYRHRSETLNFTGPSMTTPFTPVGVAGHRYPSGRDTAGGRGTHGRCAHAVGWAHDHGLVQHGRLHPGGRLAGSVASLSQRTGRSWPRAQASRGAVDALARDARVPARCQGQRHRGDCGCRGSLSGLSTTVLRATLMPILRGGGVREWVVY